MTVCGAKNLLVPPLDLLVKPPRRHLQFRLRRLREMRLGLRARLPNVLTRSIREVLGRCLPPFYVVLLKILVRELGPVRLT